MHTFSATVSTGNLRPLFRGKYDVKESLEIVTTEAEKPYVFDSFSFIESEWNDLLTGTSERDGHITVGTGTTVCHTVDDTVLGGFVLSVPYEDAELEESEIQTVANEYTERFSSTLLELFEKPNWTVSAVKNINSVFSEEQFNVSILQQSQVQLADESEQEQAEMSRIVFTDGDVINFLYLLADGDASDEDFVELVKHIDNLVGFSIPDYEFSVDSKVDVACEKVLSSNSMQTYIDSEYQFSTIGSAISFESTPENEQVPVLSIDSVLTFTTTNGMKNNLHCTLTSSRSANEFESLIREQSKNFTSIDVPEESNFLSAVEGMKKDSVPLDNGEYVLIGQANIEWACDCSEGFCPTVVYVTSNTPITRDDLLHIDSIMDDVYGQKPVEVTINELVLDSEYQTEIFL